MENQTANYFSVTASHLLEYLYCPRFTYFEYVMDIPQNEGNRFGCANLKLIRKRGLC